MCFLLIFSKITSAATRWGQHNERNACEQYQKLLGVSVCKSGFTLQADFPYLGASADGMINQTTVLEIKCPYSGREKTIRELIASGYEHIEYDDESNLQLKVTSKYYCQVQGEMAIKQVNLCHFVVWTPKDMAIITVKFDDSYWYETLLPTLQKFYENRILPLLM